MRLWTAAAALATLASAALLLKYAWRRRIDRDQLAKEYARSPVDSVKLKAYLGEWHEIARKPMFFQDNPIKRGMRTFGAGYDASAVYNLLKDGKVQVLNSQKRDSTETLLPIKTIVSKVEGRAIVVDKKSNAKLQVFFGPRWVQFLMETFGMGGQYWIYALGKEVNGQYTWSLVSDSRGKTLWILARTRELSTQTLLLIESICARERLPYDRLEFTQRPKSGGVVA